MRAFRTILITVLAFGFLVAMGVVLFVGYTPRPTPINGGGIAPTCVNGILPDRKCTPGAIFPTATKAIVCASGYAGSVRNVPASEKAAVYKEYGVLTHFVGQYEIDHLIPLELGGSNDITNLWPEAAMPTPGFHEKDMVENYLHAQMCAGKIDIHIAQARIAASWESVYNTIMYPRPIKGPF